MIFSGFLRRKIFPGPPGYEDTQQGDRPDPTYILHLDVVTCALGVDEDALERLIQFEEMQLNNEVVGAKGRDLDQSLGRFVNKHVVAIVSSGHVMTGADHAPIVVHVEAVRLGGL